MNIYSRIRWYYNPSQFTQQTKCMFRTGLYVLLTMISEYIARHQAIIWTNAEILLIRTLGRNFVEILSKIHTFAFKKMSSAKWRQFCLSLKVLMQATRLMYISLRWRDNENDGVPNHQRLDIYSTVCSNADQRKHQNSASLAFVREIHRWPVNSPHKGTKGQ